MKFAVRWFHPINFILFDGPRTDTPFDPSDDVHRYGFSLDLSTELYCYKYDWGYGVNFRLFGFGFEVNWYGS